MSESFFRRDEKEIVLDHLVKMPRGELRRAFDEGAVLRIGVAKRLELPADIAIRESHAAGHLHAAVEEEFFDALRLFVA